MRKLALVLALLGAFFVLNAKSVIAAVEKARIGTSEVYQTRNGQNCNFFNSCVQAGEDLHIKLTDIAYSNGTPFPDGEKARVGLSSDGSNCGGYPNYHDSSTPIGVENGSLELTIPGEIIRLDCSYSLKVTLPKNVGGIKNTEESVKIYPISHAATLQCGDSKEECNTSSSIVANYDLCKQQIQEGTEQFNACQTCFEGGGIWTAVGCIPSDPQSVITTVITIGLAIGGGIVLIMILVGSFMLSTSQGDPNKTKEAKEIITSAIIGLLFVIFSVTILQFIGVSILRIPGFGS